MALATFSRVFFRCSIASMIQWAERMLFMEEFRVVVSLTWLSSAIRV